MPVLGTPTISVIRQKRVRKERTMVGETTVRTPAARAHGRIPWGKIALGALALAVITASTVLLMMVFNGKSGATTPDSLAPDSTTDNTTSQQDNMVPAAPALTGAMGSQTNTFLRPSGTRQVNVSFELENIDPASVKLPVTFAQRPENPKTIAEFVAAIYLPSPELVNPSYPQHIIITFISPITNGRMDADFAVSTDRTQEDGVAICLDLEGKTVVRYFRC